MRNDWFCFSRPPILAPKTHPKNKYFQYTFLDTLLHDLMLILCENGRFWNPFNIQWAPKWNSKSAKGIPKAQIYHWLDPLWGCWSQPFFPNRIGLKFWWLLVDLWSMWGRCFTILSNWLMGLLLFWAPFLNRILQMLLLDFSWRTRFWLKSAKICQDKSRSNKIKLDQPNNRQA